MKNCSYYFCVLDIETSTTFKQVSEKNKYGEKVLKNVPSNVWLSYGYFKVYNIFGETVDKLLFRYWKELELYLNTLSLKFKDYKLLCFVHNLGYEFDFLIKNISLPKTILSNTTHNTISSILRKHKNIEYRCTYLLSGYSLAKIGEMVGLKKLDSDYRTIYPGEKITKEEDEYCERDCDIVAKYILSLLKEYKKLFNIPYTKTGRVRKVFNEFYEKEINPQWDLMPPENCYQAMLKAFSGGVTTSNPLYTNIKLYNVHSYDIRSSYPYVMLKEKYPYTIEKCKEFTEADLLKPFWIAKIKVNYVKSKYLWQWVSISKIESNSDDCVFFNGKLMHGIEIVKYFTNVDFEIFKKTYDYESIEVLEYYKMENYDYLPYPYIETIKLYGEKKDKLKELHLANKHDKEIERDYMLSKNDFNSIYGMSVQKLIQSDYSVDKNFQWVEIEKEYVQTKKHMKRNFLFGIYITAYARRNLINAIIENCPDTFVYCDTDSIKFIGENKFKDTNIPLHYPYCDISYLKKLGKFEYEGTYKEFKTLGAKKYCFLNDENEIEMVVAGLPKNAGKIKDMNEFSPGKIFENCKLGKKYFINGKCFDSENDGNGVLSNIEEYEIIENSDTIGGVALYPTSYELDITKIDNSIIYEYQKVYNEQLHGYNKRGE